MSVQQCVVGTWPFSQEPVLKAMQHLCNNYTSIDAVEAGINLAELDFDYGRHHIGCGGYQNAELILELDAAIMDGADLNFGAVTALKGFPQAISVARKVMDKSQHSMLSGEGATNFARSQGFEFQNNLGTAPKPHVVTPSKQSPGHDTLGILALDKKGNLCAGVSTSGISGKEPGRVGDSALPGCGLYADSEAGAACCSGDGDDILKYCSSYKAVDLIKQGYSPQDACVQTVKDIIKRRGPKKEFQMVIIALDKKGNHGAANFGVHPYTDEVTGTHYQGFTYFAFSENMKEAQLTNVQRLTLDNI